MNVIFEATLKVANEKGVPFYFNDMVTDEESFKQNIRFHDGVGDWLVPDWSLPQPYYWEDVEVILEETTDKLLKQDCKAKAKQLLADSDWAVTPDVQAALENPLDWINYREAVRRIFLNPIAHPSFPVLPEVRWTI